MVGIILGPIQKVKLIKAAVKTCRAPVHNRCKASDSAKEILQGRFHTDYRKEGNEASHLVRGKPLVEWWKTSVDR